jgi:CopG family nickel-responsive transcriptional regulator
MKDPLVRFGVAIENSLLRDLDALVRERGCTRSELLRDLARSEVGRAKIAKGVDAVCTLTLVYDHHVRDLSEKLTELQHQLGEGVRAALHVHLTHDLCLEVVIMRGKSDQLQAVANRILAMRGVKHGGVEIVAGLGEAHPPHPHGHPPAAPPVTAAETARSSASSRGRAVRRGAPARSGTVGSPAQRPRRGRSRRG